MLDRETLGHSLGLRYFEGPGYISLRNCETANGRGPTIRCVAIICELGYDLCHVLVTYEVPSHEIDISPKILTTKRIDGERARLVRDRIKEISHLSVDDALIEFNTLLREVLENS
jgi:hypothetical protein